VKADVVALQEAAAHETLVAPWVQAPAPLQVPVLPQGAAELTAHWPAGAVALGASGAQVPAFPVTLQAWQVPQAVLDEQHTPSMQLPLLHSCPSTQVAPCAFLATQLPPVAAVQ
jgi:hypothetical protein